MFFQLYYPDLTEAGTLAKNIDKLPLGMVSPILTRRSVRLDIAKRMIRDAKARGFACGYEDDTSESVILVKKANT